MAKVYRVVTLERVKDSGDLFRVVSATEWGSELGKARKTMDALEEHVSDGPLLCIEKMEAPTTREEFVTWLNGQSDLSRVKLGTEDPVSVGEDPTGIKED